VSNPAARLVQTEIVGMSESGKTTLAFKVLLNTPAAVRFIYDEEGHAARRLNKKWVGTARECEDALATRWVCFNPTRMFPGCLPETEQGENAFRWFCKWVFDVSKRGRGRKIVLIDELWKWCNRRRLPIEFANLAVAGRVEEIELMLATQTPEKIPFAIAGQCTEVICFTLQHQKAIDALEELRLVGFDGNEIWNLKQGEFISFGRKSRTKLRSKIF